jgi:hypothetical protein
MKGHVSSMRLQLAVANGTTNPNSHNSTMETLITESVIGLVALAAFQYRNPHKALLNTVSLFVFLLFVAKELMHSYTWAMWLLIIASVGLFVSYLVRFRRKGTVYVFDYIKWIGVGFLLFYPAPLFQLPDPYRGAPYLVSDLTIPVLAAIYLYDRWILKPEKMKKKFVIILSAQTVLILVMLTFALFQRALAERYRDKASEQAAIASEQRMQAEMARQEAQRARAQLQTKLDSITSQKH